MYLINICYVSKGERILQTDKQRSEKHASLFPQISCFEPPRLPCFYYLFKINFSFSKKLARTNIFNTGPFQFSNRSSGLDYLFIYLIKTNKNKTRTKKKKKKKRTYFMCNYFWLVFFSKSTINPKAFIVIPLHFSLSLSSFLSVSFFFQFPRLFIQVLGRIKIYH